MNFFAEVLDGSEQRNQASALSSYYSKQGSAVNESWQHWNKSSGTTRIKTRAAEWEAWALSLCYATPHVRWFLFVFILRIICLPCWMSWKIRASRRNEIWGKPIKFSWQIIDNVFFLWPFEEWKMIKFFSLLFFSVDWALAKGPWKKSQQ